jgi:hypothetical protein
MGRRTIIRKSLGTKIKFQGIGTEPAGSIYESRWGPVQRFVGSRLRLASLCRLFILITSIWDLFCILLQNHRSRKVVDSTSTTLLLQQAIDWLWLNWLRPFRAFSLLIEFLILDFIFSFLFSLEHQKSICLVTESGWTDHNAGKRYLNPLKIQRALSLIIRISRSALLQ